MGHVSARRTRSKPQATGSTISRMARTGPSASSDTTVSAVNA